MSQNRHRREKGATMISFPTTKVEPDVKYPTGDGQPMAETPTHRDNMIALIDVLRTHFVGNPMVYVSANMFIYYAPGRKRRYVSPDVFVVKGIPDKDRDAYFVWEEGKGPDVVFEMTSASSEDEDLGTKFLLYQDVLRVPEYFLFDPKEEYLDPSLQGYKLVKKEYRPIDPVEGRFPSEVLGLHLERDGSLLRLYDPVRRQRLLTSPEARELAEAELRRAETERQRAEAEAKAMTDRWRQSEAERVRLEREVD
jgi:Uma2 family endonuclease